MPSYRVLVVDDSRFMRKVFSDMIGAHEAFTVEATASDGEEAVKLALELRPDIITMDLEMPRMNGLEALRRIMAARPAPVIMLSAVTDNGTRDTIKALQYGAFDFIRKPDGAVRLDIGQVSGQLLEKLLAAAESISSGTFRMLPAVEDQETHSRGLARKHPAKEALLPGQAAADEIPPPDRPAETTDRQPAALGPMSPPREPQTAARVQLPPAAPPKPAEPAKPAARKPRDGGVHPPPRIAAAGPAAASKPAVPPAPEVVRRYKPSPVFHHLVAIGTSTGGPRALHEVLTKLPEDFAAPVLIVQHMPPKFTHSLAQRLDAFCAIRVREASHGDVVETGTAYIAPGGKHMSLTMEKSGKYRIKLSQEGPRSGHMPSVDVLFESLVGFRQLKRHAVLMTGMGSDGAKGMMALRDDGAVMCIAESEETCVVYGMPRSAAESGAATHLLPLQQIAQALVKEVKSRTD